ncbi:MAG: class I SAM-dependent methyltransferase [Candidatus Hatepunaea meridiana]|nr:class I SAM-dependent methyltransferase [Candidatus Hatepunaea meridiana]
MKQSEWYRQWFDENYLLVYSHRDKREAADFASLWPIWKYLKPGGWCLDLGCGTGRYAYEIQKRGLNVLGIDLSAPLLKIAQSVRNNQYHTARSIWFVRADMRSLPIMSGVNTRHNLTNTRHNFSGGPFSLIVSLFTSFGYFDDNEHLQIIRQIRKLLLPDGIFIIDIPNPVSVRKTVSDKPVTIRTVNGVNIKEERYIDEKACRVIKEIEIERQGRKQKYYESVKLFNIEELKALLKLNGIKQIEDCWGDYQGTRFELESPRIIYFGKVNG